MEVCTHGIWDKNEKEIEWLKVVAKFADDGGHFQGIFGFPPKPTDTSKDILNEHRDRLLHVGNG